MLLDELPGVTESAAFGGAACRPRRGLMWRSSEARSRAYAGGRHRPRQARARQFQGAEAGDLRAGAAATQWAKC